MKYALISPKEGNRFCETSQSAFPVAAPLHWVECADDVTAETHDYVGGEFVAKPPKTGLPASGVKEM